MSQQKCDRVVSAIARQRWAITQDGLELILGIAQREVSDHQAVLSSPTARRESGNIRMRDGVAVISIMGPIFPRADFFAEISGATSIETLGLRFGEALAADDVKGIVLHVDSQGGSVTGIHEFASQVFAARGIKPVVAYVSGVCASAAYWIASASGRVVADETAVLGSIGVVAAWTDDKEARKSAGLTDYEVVSSQSPNKRLDPTSQEGRAALQHLLDTDADIFIADVARHRGKCVATVTDQFGQGGVMHAAEAVKVGMADAIGNLEGVIAELSGSVGLPKADRSGLTAHINKETSMDKEQLAKAHPELLAQIQAEARAEGEKAGKADADAAVANCLGMVRLVAGEETATKVQQLTASGISAEQVAQVTSVVAPVASVAGQDAATAASDASSRTAILTAIREGTPAPVNTSASVAGADPLQAAIDRISTLTA